ncbi:MAG: hypothetical protein LBS27_07890 [Bifidobacteriaceae bacterium]|nr:hypothetical protein [Bifidobacteriaceae bacterium]
MRRARAAQAGPADGLPDAEVPLPDWLAAAESISEPERPRPDFPVVPEPDWLKSGAESPDQSPSPGQAPTLDWLEEPAAPLQSTASTLEPPAVPDQDRQASQVVAQSPAPSTERPPEPRAPATASDPRWSWPEDLPQAGGAAPAPDSPAPTSSEQDHGAPASTHPRPQRHKNEAPLRSRWRSVAIIAAAAAIIAAAVISVLVNGPG